MQLSKIDIFKLICWEYVQTYPELTSPGKAAMQALKTFDLQTYESVRHFSVDPSIYEYRLNEFFKYLEDRWDGE